ncbi:MAG: hypothetical protein KAJ51_11795, partial [Thermoplasmata archaeon]|nr:hypothetical protein [Thermoplasmata archaeon]
AYEDTYYEVNYEYEDIDLINVGQTGTWNYSTNATWLNFNPVPVALSGTPMNNEAGEYWVNISINDSMEMDFTNFTLTVIDINDNPVIDTINVEITYEDAEYFVDYNAIDIDSPLEEQVWHLQTNASSWLSINSDTGVISGTPTNDDVDTYWVNVSVYDGESGIGFTNFDLTVINVNDPPLITTEDVLTVQVGTSYDVDYNATDIDSLLTKQTWYLETNASWLKISSRTGVISGSPTIANLGWFNVNITIEDGDGGQDWHEFILTVIRENKPPIITTIDVISVTVNVVYWVDYEAVDDYTPFDKLFWSLETNASWLNIEPNTGVLTGLPKLSDAGEYWINISVSDGEGGLDFHNFTLNVYTTPNQPPTILTEDKITAIVNIAYSVDYNAIDDRTPIYNLKWSLQTNASWLSIDTSTGVLSGTPEFGDLGWYWINVSVKDDENGLDYHYFTLKVLKVPNNAPELSNPTITPLKGNTETEFTFSVRYYDADGNLPSYVKLIIGDEEYKMILKSGNESGGIYECTIKLSEGEHTYYFSASDGIETASTDNNITPYIKEVDNVSEEEPSWYWLIWVIIIVIILISLIVLFVYKRQKAKKIPTVRAEILHAPPAHLFPSVTSGIKGAESLPPQPTISEQLPTQKVPVPSLAPTHMKPQLQLPQATLTKAQKLGLLEERFLRGEVD